LDLKSSSESIRPCVPMSHVHHGRHVMQRYSNILWYTGQFCSCFINKSTVGDLVKKYKTWVSQTEVSAH